MKRIAITWMNWIFKPAYGWMNDIFTELMELGIYMVPNYYLHFNGIFIEWMGFISSS